MLIKIVRDGKRIFNLDGERDTVSTYTGKDVYLKSNSPIEKCTLTCLSHNQIIDLYSNDSTLAFDARHVHSIRITGDNNFISIKANSVKESIEINGNHNTVLLDLASAELSLCGKHFNIQGDVANAEVSFHISQSKVDLYFSGSEINYSGVDVSGDLLLSNSKAEFLGADYLLRIESEQHSLVIVKSVRGCEFDLFGNLDISGDGDASLYLHTQQPGEDAWIFDMHTLPRDTDGVYHLVPGVTNPYTGKPWNEED